MKLRSRHDFEVATWSGWLEVVTRNGRCYLARKGLRSRPEMEVATWLCGRPVLASQEETLAVVSRHRFDVATWFWLPYGGLVSRPRFWVATGAFLWEEQRLVATSI